jgi:hypothetical protein
LLAVLLVTATAVSVPAFAQAARSLTPVSPQELTKFNGAMVFGRSNARIGYVVATDRDLGTVQVIAYLGQVATIPVSLLGREGMELHAPAVTFAAVARASYGGQSRIPLRGEVTVTEDEGTPNSVQ